MNRVQSRRGASPRVGGIGSIVVTASTVILFLTTFGVLILGFVTSAGALMHLPTAVIAGGDGVAGIFLLWLAWVVGRAAWQSEQRLASGADAVEAPPTDPH